MVEQDKQESQAGEDEKEFSKVRMGFMKHLYLASSALLIFIGTILPHAPQGQQMVLKACAGLFFLSIFSATVMLLIDCVNYGRHLGGVPSDEFRVMTWAFVSSIISFALGSVVFL